MLRTNTALWRITFLSGLGILPAGCGGNASDPAAPGDPGTPIAADAQRPKQPGKNSPAPSTPSTPDAPPWSPQPDVQPLRQPTACLGSAVYLVGGVDTGLERCADGRLHRPDAAACTSRLPREGFADAGAADAGARSRASADAGPRVDEAGIPYPVSACTSDADCSAKPLGHCEQPANDGTWNLSKLCQYGCLTDADCGAGFLCQCGDPVGACVPAGCRTDSECGAGMLCAQAANYQSYCPVTYVFSCESPSDRCRVDGECAGLRGGLCRISDGERICADDGSVVCGRPFLVQGSARLAQLAHTSAWLARCSRPDCSRLSAEQRRQFARGWSQLGLMEHASVAAFARFTLQLLSLGAPALLVEQSQQAMADELVHARLCFGLASGYAEQPLGPGPLPIEHALELTSLEDIAALTLHEGCVGETIAALEASEARAAASDPAVREALTRIEADERRHAQLAWRFVIWSLNTGGPRVQRRIQRELAGLGEGAAEIPLPSAEESFDGAAQGLLCARQRAELRAAALRDVVLPCARALLGVELGAEPALPGV
jgi:hypothetical protein